MHFNNGQLDCGKIYNGSENDANKVKYIEVNLYASNLAFHFTGSYHFSVDQNHNSPHREK